MRAFKVLFHAVCKTIYAKQKAVFLRKIAFFSVLDRLLPTFNLLVPTMPVEKFMTHSAITIPGLGVSALANPSTVQSSICEVSHNCPPDEWKLDGSNYYHYWKNGRHTDVYVRQITWIPVIHFPHKITLQKPVWRVLSYLESPYILDAPSLKEAKRIGECYYSIRQNVNSNGTVPSSVSVGITC